MAWTALKPSSHSATISIVFFLGQLLPDPLARQRLVVHENRS